MSSVILRYLPLKHLYTHSIVGGQGAEGQFYHRLKTTAAHGLVPWAASSFVPRSLCTVGRWDERRHFGRVRFGDVRELLLIVRRDRLESGHGHEREHLSAQRRCAGVLHAVREGTDDIRTQGPLPNRDYARGKRLGRLEDLDHLEPARIANLKGL